ncbi:MAG: hypothetical protein V4594_22450 [Bacteroidota bacterium]
MGTFDGKRIRGLVGSVVFRQGRKNQEIVQTAPASLKQTKATKIAGKTFGQGSTLACVIREDLRPVTLDNYDGDMVNDFATPVRDVLKQCFDKETGFYTFEQDSFARLEGFEFNPRSLLINSLLVAPETALNGNTFTVSIPEFEVPQKFKFPGNTNVCRLRVGVSVIALHAGLNIDLLVQELEISAGEHIVPASAFEFEVSEGCLCVAAISLTYFRLHEGIKAVYNFKDFHPAAVCGAIVTPGTFIVPPPYTKVGNKTIPTKWCQAGRIKLPAKPAEQDSTTEDPSGEE